MGEQCDLLINEVQTRAKDDPNKQQVVTMLSTCKADALANQLNLVGISVFSVTLENTLSDGVISDAERLSLETRKNEMAQPH